MTFYSMMNFDLITYASFCHSCPDDFLSQIRIDCATDVKSLKWSNWKGRQTEQPHKQQNQDQRNSIVILVLEFKKILQ